MVMCDCSDGDAEGGKRTGGERDVGRRLEWHLPRAPDGSIYERRRHKKA